MSDSGDYIFDKGRFVGDFDGLYKAQPDPWGQSCQGNTPMDRYYVGSRANLVTALRRRISSRDCLGLEIGCGHGHLTNILAGLTSRSRWRGLDISPTAVFEAAERHPDITFMVRDITQPINDQFHVNIYDAIVLGQMFWYIIPDRDTVMSNCRRMLKKGGLLVVSQAFFKDGGQKFYTAVSDGFVGAVRLLMGYVDFELVEAKWSEHPSWEFDDGLIILRAK